MLRSCRAAASRAARSASLERSAIGRALHVRAVDSGYRSAPLVADGGELAGFINGDRDGHKSAQIMGGSHKVPGFCGDFAALESLRFHCDQENERIFSRSQYCLGVIVKVAQFLAAFCS